MMKYKLRSDIAISDYAFYVYGKSYKELIKNACIATTDSMVDHKKIEEKVEEGITLKSPTMEQLLYDILEEVIYLKDSKQLVFKKFKIEKLKSTSPDCHVTMTMKGEKIDREKHKAHADVKAVTLLDFGIKKTKEGYRASVVLDV